MKVYLLLTLDSNESSVLLHLISGKHLNAGGVSYWLVKAIACLLPGSIEQAHGVRKPATSLAWYRGVPTKEIIAAIHVPQGLRFSRNT